MGIQGLLPLLKSIQYPITMAELSGNTVGVDAYCWLHKGAYACALQLAEGKDSDVYVNYVMRRVNMMLYHKVKPILVFDGGYLPSKREKEVERRNKRRENKSMGMSHLQSGNRTEAMEYFQKSIDITPDMAYKVIKACREKGVDCIVAPHEADAQLAYLTKLGITQFTISEDSDLLIYGCEKVIFKMDANGLGLLINLKNLPKLSGLRMDGFTEEKFRQMCILSGCDYLPSIKGMGLITSHKLLRLHSTVNKLIGTLRLNNKMKVPKDYETRFAHAEQTFLYQIVFDPYTGKHVPLNPVPEHINADDLEFAGHRNGMWKPEQAVQLALGNINPITGHKMGNIKVDKIISFDKQEEKRREKKEKTTTTTPTTCAQKKGPYSVMSSNGKYEAQKNLNGSFRETKSSGKSNTPFVTPMRNKRTRSVSSEEKLYEGSQLAKLYQLTENEEPLNRVRRRLEADPADDESQSENQPPTEPAKKKFRNPFRSPERVVKQDKPVVSRFFGLAGMDSKNQESFQLSKIVSDSNEDDPTVAKKDRSPQNTNFLPTEDSLTSGEHTESQQDSGYSTSSQTNESSPTENSRSNQSVYKNTTPLLPQTPTSHVLTEIKLLVGKHRTITERKNRELLKKKPKSTSQTLLDKFAYVRMGVTNADISENCEDNARDRNEKGEDLTKEIFTKIFENSLDGTAKNPSSETLEKHKPKDIVQKTKTTIGLRSKPSTGLGRCRAVGMRRPQVDGKKKSPAGVETPLLDFFKYRRRSQEII